MAPNRNKGGPTDIMDEDISYPLARLFDRFNLDHVPEKKRMEIFEHRDLAHVKHYKAAVKIFGGPLSRKRVMIAPPMETPMKHRLGLYLDKKPPPAPPQLNSELKPQIPPVIEEPEELKIAREAREREDNYKSWFRERQKFRNDLENMGLNSDWLAKKPNKTTLEKRVLRQLKEKEGKAINEDELRETPAEETSRTSTRMTDDSDSSVPHIRVPAPLGLQILDKYLKEQKLRLIDIFTASDKNKDWNISREEFVKICEEWNIPLSKALLEDMLISLDMNLDDELNYKELARGMELARRERREDKRKELSRESTMVSQKSGSQGSDRQSNDNKRVSSSGNTSHVSSSGSGKSGTVKTPDKQADASTSSASKNIIANASISSKSTKKSEKVSDSSDKITEVSNNSKISDQKSHASKDGKSDSSAGTSKQGKVERAGSPVHLEPPDVDTAPDRLILKTEEEMVDLRKHDREALKGYNNKIEGVPPTILTGSKCIDDHCMKSTMTGDVGEMMDNFRQKRLQEYFEIVKLCKENDVILSQSLLEKVLLYPGEKPHSELKGKLRPPDSAPLVSSHFADPPKRPRTPIEVKHKDKVRRSKSGKLLIDSRHRYPSMANVAPVGSKQNLSTGRAVIRRMTDCWMTFEEYEMLTRRYAVKYQHIGGTSNENAFWPGHMLDKMRLCMPPYDKPARRNKEDSIYTKVERKPAVNYGYEAVDVWPINDSKYTQIGIHDPFRNKTIF